MWWAPLVGLATSLIGNAIGGQGESPAPAKPPPPKPEFQPLQRQAPMTSRQPLNFDPGASASRMTQGDPQLEALARLRSKLGL